GVFLVVGLVGLVLSVVGAWWMVTERMPRGAVGILSLVLGAAVLVVAVLRAANEALAAGILLFVALALRVGAVVTPQAALGSYLRRTPVGVVQRARRPARPVLLCNPWSGGGKVDTFGLVPLANSLGVETVLLDHGLDLETLARDAVAGGADCLGMAGGGGAPTPAASLAGGKKGPLPSGPAGPAHPLPPPLRPGPRAPPPPGRGGPAPPPAPPDR